MADYEVQRGRRARVLTADRIRWRLARGRLASDAPVRRAGESAWRSLREFPELLEPPAARPDAGQDGWQLLQGLAANAGAWAITSFALHLPGIVVLWWGFGVAMHALTVARKLAARRREAARPLPEAARSEEALPVGPAPAALPAADPFLSEFEAAVASLEAAAGPAGLPGGVDLAALRGAASELRRQHLALEALSGGGARERLAHERDEAEAGAARAADPRTAEVLREQARSVEAGLAGLEQAAGASARLAARERTLLHQIEAMRLSILQTGLDEERAPDLAGEVQRLQLDLRANAEIEADLARARLGARLQRT